MGFVEHFENKIDVAPRWLTIPATHVVFYGLYLATNRYQLTQPRFLPFVPGEEAIPFVGWTSYIYLTILFVIPVTMCLLPKPGFGRAVVSGMGLVALHIAIFVLFPTEYPRPSGPSGHTITDLIWRADAPANAFPSLHVAISFFLAFALGRMGRRTVGAVLLAWAAVISVSTLTVKQHYALDSVAAIAVAFVASRRIGSFGAKASP
ncbi:MAG TPA: phosphatase PAP2 family protein [Candidatus Methylomirabilis sp.]|nr:phosphatase PAP2 family protein [Candidatus Methylomirabilis sp.]